MSNPLTEPVARFGVRAPKIQHTTNLVFKPVTEIVSPRIRQPLTGPRIRVLRAALYVPASGPSRVQQCQNRDSPYVIS